MITTAIKERPILFRPEMVRAILDGRKTQTRRVVKPQPVQKVFNAPMNSNDWAWPYPNGGGCRISCKPNGPDGWVDEYAPWKRGDVLWVKERIYIDEIPYDTGPLPKTRPQLQDPDCIYYRTDGDCCKQIPECACCEVGKPKWRSSIHMPKWAARLWLEITDVRVERVQSISEEDARAEGCFPDVLLECPKDYIYGGQRWCQHDFANLWQKINGKTHPWKSNPWVWVISFKRIDRPSLTERPAPCRS